MHNSRRRESGSAVARGSDFIPDANFGFAFKNEIQLVLSGVRVRGVFLSRLKAIQADEQGLATRDIDLAHFFGREVGKVGDAFDNHVTIMATPTLAGNGSSV